MRLLTEVLYDFVDLIFPSVCVACQQPLSRGEKSVCTNCLVHLPYTNYHLKRDNPLSMRFWGKIEIEYAVAYLTFTRSGRVQRILHQLKYKGAKELGVLLGNWYGAVLLHFPIKQEVDLIVPVPLHKAKQRVRGYNQAAQFAQGLSEAMELPHVPDALRRNVFTSTQTSKARLERWQNVEEVFSVPDPEVVKGRHVLLVDDVITTGSTLEACARMLYKAGCAKVSIAALAAA